MMPKSMLPFCTLCQRAAKPCLKSSIFVSSLNMALATSLAMSMSKPTSSPLSSMKPNGGASLVTPTITLPRASTSSSLDLVAPAACAAALEEVAIASPATPAPPSAAPRKSRRSMVDPPPAGSTRMPRSFRSVRLAPAGRGTRETSQGSFGGDRSVAHGQRARLAHVHFPGEPSHRARDGNIEPPDDVLDLSLADDQWWGEAEVVLHRDRYDPFQRAVVADALGHYRIGAARLLVFDDIEHAIEALAAHLAGAGIFPLEREELLLGELPQPVCALVELVAQNDLQLL